MKNYSVFPVSYTVGPDAYKKIPEYCRIYGTKAVVLGGETAISKARNKIQNVVADSDIQILDYIVCGKECSYQSAEQAELLSSVLEADMIFAVGGGKAVDTCKIVGHHLCKPVFTFPTIVSNCAASSALAIIYNEDHSFAQFLHLDEGAKHVFIDTEICAQAPNKFLWAGIGDTYAKYYEVSISAKGEKLPHYLALGVNMSRMCWDTLEEHGARALRDNIAQKPSYDFEQAALAIIITTGYVSMFVAKEHNMMYNGGVAHAFFYGLCNKPGFDVDHLHGVVVGFGVLILLMIDGREDEAKKLIEFNQTVGLPVKLSDIGVSMDDVEKYAEYMVKDEDLEHYPYKVTQQMIIEAAKKLDT